MHFSGQVNQYLATLEDELETYRGLVPLAENLQIPLSDHRNAIEQYASDLDSLQDEFEYNAQHVEECKNLIENIIEKRKNLDREVKNKKGNISQALTTKKVR